MTYRLAYRLTDILDPEERLEEAALFKAMSDYYGRDAVLAFRGVQCPDPDLPVFGRNPSFQAHACNPVTARLDYWTDEAFLGHVGREFHAVPYEDVASIADRMLSEGKSVFVKSSRQKHFKLTLKPGDSFADKIGDMAYSFIDGPLLLVQELVPVEYEYRFFIIDRNVVTGSANMQDLTPLDFPLAYGAVFKTPLTADPDRRPDVVEAFHELAGKIAAEMDTPHACVDIAMIDGKPSVVEFNPMQLGHLGLFACDVRALAEASESLVMSYAPEMEVATKAAPEESDFFDL